MNLSSDDRVGLCFIVKQGSGSPATIYTLRFSGENDEDVKRHLDRALESLPFPTRYNYVLSDCTDAAKELLRSVFVTNLVDSPGASEVLLTLSAKISRNFFLPRDPTTGAFVAIADQTQCLEVLKYPKREE